VPEAACMHYNTSFLAHICHDVLQTSLLHTVTFGPQWQAIDRSCTHELCVVRSYQPHICLPLLHRTSLCAIHIPSPTEAPALQEAEAVAVTP
jgi:hypothetical protein